MVWTCQDCGQEFSTLLDYDSHRQDEHLTLRFLCCLYTKSLNDVSVSTYGMKPEAIYERLELQVNTGWKQKVKVLVTNCVLNGHVIRLDNTVLN
jgi:hypothetical protein